MFMMMLVLDDPDLLDDVLEAWSKAGVRGATIFETTGLHRRRQAHVPMRYLYGDTSLDQNGNYSLYAIVENETIVHACLNATENVVGNLDDPNTGIFTAWPLTIVKGLPMKQREQE